MGNPQRFGGLATLLSLALTAGLSAQSMSVSPSPVLLAGGQATIEYENPALAGQTVTIEVSGGYPYVIQEVKITLGADGSGTGTWSVPTDWWGAAFNGPGVPQIARAIKLGSTYS